MTTEQLRKALSSDLQKFLNIETNGNCSCNEYCQREGICRSFEITGIMIQSVHIDRLADYVLEKFSDTKSKGFIRNDKIRLLFDGVDKRIDLYCLERILTINKVWETIYWEWNYINGYYGHEIDKIYLNEDIVNQICEQYQECSNKTRLNEKMEYLLTLEYGYILPTLEGCNYSIDEIDRELIFFPQKNHHQKVKKKSIYRLRNSDQIMGLCSYEDGSYRVIDGYNRLSQSKLKKVTIINAFK